MPRRTSKKVFDTVIRDEPPAVEAAEGGHALSEELTKPRVGDVAIRTVDNHAAPLVACDAQRKLFHALRTGMSVSDAAMVAGVPMEAVKAAAEKYPQFRRCLQANQGSVMQKAFEALLNLATGNATERVEVNGENSSGAYHETKVKTLPPNERAIKALLKSVGATGFTDAPAQTHINISFGGSGTVNLPPAGVRFDPAQLPADGSQPVPKLVIESHD